MFPCYGTHIMCFKQVNTTATLTNNQTTKCFYLPLIKLQKQICSLFTRMLILPNIICRKIRNTVSHGRITIIEHWETLLHRPPKLLKKDLTKRTFFDKKLKSLAAYDFYQELKFNPSCSVFTYSLIHPLTLHKEQ